MAKEKEIIEFGENLADRIMMDEYENKGNKKYEPAYEVVEHWDNDPNDNWEGTVLIFKRIVDNKLFRAEYVMRFDGDIRSADDEAVEVKKIPITTYIYE